MKRTASLFIGIILSLGVFAQVPQKMNYQAVIRNSSDALVANTRVGMQISIRQGSATGTVVYTETQTPTTNANGLVSIEIGNEADFEAIDWAEGPYFIEVKTDPEGGTNYTITGSSQLLSVPYALYAASGTPGPQGPQGPEGPLVAGAEGQTLRHDGTTWEASSNIYNTGDNVGIGTTSPTEKLHVEGNIRAHGMMLDKQGTPDEEPLFIVRNSDGNTVFAVYEQGVRIYVDGDPADEEKGNRSGFAIGGLTGFKDTGEEYFRVSRGYTQVMFDDEGKGNRSGFAIGGLTGFKAGEDEKDYLSVSREQTQVLFDNEAKGNRSGFFIGGLTGFKEGKDSGSSFFDVTTDATGIIDPAENRVLWYPLKNAFLAGKVLVESPENVGENSFAVGFESRGQGEYSQAMGYQAQALGDYSTAIGNEAKAGQKNSFAFGEDADAQGEESYAIGRGALAQGFRSFALGSAGVDSAGTYTQNPQALGSYSFALGMGAKAIGKGAFAMGLETKAEGPYSTALGYKTQTFGYYSTAMGYKTMASNMSSTAMGDNTLATGYVSTAMGYKTLASGNSSTALGYGTVAHTICMTAIGKYNWDVINSEPSNNYHWILTNPVFAIGIGSDSLNRRNAMTVLKGGQVGLQSVIEPSYALELPNNAKEGEGSALATAWKTYADSRVEFNPQPISYGLAEVLLMAPKTYYQHNSTIENGSIVIAPEGKQDIGLVAQEVYEIIPEVVSVPDNEESQLWGLDYDKLVPVLVKAIQEQQVLIESQNNTINQLLNRIEHLEELVDG